jgi:hypothetical protein
LFERVLQGGLKDLGSRCPLGKAATVDVIRSEEPVARQETNVHHEASSDKNIPAQSVRECCREARVWRKHRWMRDDCDGQGKKCSDAP